jgi:DNA primase
MITVQRKLQLIEASFGKVKLAASGKDVIAICPFCQIIKKTKSTKRKLAINLETGIYHCWVCESKGPNIGSVALKHSLQNEIAKELFVCFKRSNHKEEIKEEQTVILPSDFKMIANFYRKDKSSKLGFEYLSRRGFPLDKIWRFKVGVSNIYPFKDRVIFPSFDNDQKLNYFVARTINKENKKRYYNCKISRKNIIFNEIDLDFSKPLVIVEGVFDLLNCPENATCILGSWIDHNYHIFQKIVQNNTPVILCLDYDAMEKTQKIAKMLYEYCIDVRISQHSSKDFGDMERDEVNYWIDTSKRFDNINRISYLIKGIRSGSIY